VWRRHPSLGRVHSHTWRVHIHKVRRRHPGNGRVHSSTWRVSFHKVWHRHLYLGRVQRHTWTVRPGRRQGRRRHSISHRGGARRRPEGNHAPHPQRQSRPRKGLGKLGRPQRTRLWVRSVGGGEVARMAVGTNGISTSSGGNELGVRGGL
jgi:hypothetical protein